MKRSMCVLAALCCALAAAAGCNTLKAGRGASEGEKLVRRLWSDIKEKNLAAVEAMIAPGFQSLHQDGARDRDAEIELLKGLDIGRISLGDFRDSQAGPVLIVTYTLAAEETIGGKRLSRTKAWRMSVFLKEGERWLWVAHANMVPLGKG